MNCGCWKATTCQLRQYATEVRGRPAPLRTARGGSRRDADDVAPRDRLRAGQVHPVRRRSSFVRRRGRVNACGLAIVGRGAIRGNRRGASQGHPRGRRFPPSRARVARHLPDGARVAVEGRRHLRDRPRHPADARCGGRPRHNHSAERRRHDRGIVRAAISGRQAQTKLDRPFCRLLAADY